jgi:hypothetical protein
MEQLEDLRDRLKEKSFNAYCNMVSLSCQEESLGWEMKVKKGEFGVIELEAHKKMGELLGKHRAFAEVCRELGEMIKAQRNKEIGHGTNAKSNI